MSDDLPNEPRPPAPHPSPWYPPPPYGYDPAPMADARSRGFGRANTAGIVVIVLVIGALSYGLGGYLVASDRISGAAGAINAVDSNRNTINSAFDNIHLMMSGSGTFSPSAGKSMAAEIVSLSQTLGSTVAARAQALRSSQLKLNDLSWLTIFSRGRLDPESRRVDYARNAVAEVDAAAGDYGHLGVFLQSYFQVFVDFDDLATAGQNNDAAGYANVLLSLGKDVVTSLQLETMPYLPPAYRDQLTALQAEINDLKQELAASTSGDQAGYSAAAKAYDADVQKASAVDFSGNGPAMLSHFQQYRDDFNLELDKATA
jgi:hypothetical protein